MTSGEDVQLLSKLDRELIFYKTLIRGKGENYVTTARRMCRTGCKNKEID